MNACLLLRNCILSSLYPTQNKNPWELEPPEYDLYTEESIVSLYECDNETTKNQKYSTPTTLSLSTDSFSFSSSSFSLISRIYVEREVSKGFEEKMSIEVSYSDNYRREDESYEYNGSLNIQSKENVDKKKHYYRNILEYSYTNFDNDLILSLDKNDIHNNNKNIPNYQPVNTYRTPSKYLDTHYTTLCDLNLDKDDVPITTNLSHTSKMMVKNILTSFDSNTEKLGTERMKLEYPFHHVRHFSDYTEITEDNTETFSTCGSLEGVKYSGSNP